MTEAHPCLPAILYWPLDAAGHGSGGYGARVSCCLCGRALHGLRARIEAFRQLHRRGCGAFHLSLVRQDLARTSERDLDAFLRR